MRLWEAVLIALRSVRAHRLRSALTMLGLSIGVSSVILLVAIGDGVQKSVNARIEPLANLITIVATNADVPASTPPKNLIDADVTALQKEPNVLAATPVITGLSLIGAGAASSTPPSRTIVVGSTDHWFEVAHRDIQAGSFFTPAHLRSSARVVVLGPTALTNLFAGDAAAALGHTVHINHQSFAVIGVLAPVGLPGDDVVVMPLSAARSYVFGRGEILNQVLVQATHAGAVPAAQTEVTRVLDNRHRIRNPASRDYQVQTLTAHITSLNQVLRILTLFTAAIAAISLLVGSIGILNIMLVSVTERTREIGIRKALGATRRAILGQFLIESLVLAGIGGAIGIGTGIGLSVLCGIIASTSRLGPLLSDFTPIVTPVPVAASFLISLTIGLIAGCYPACCAARLRPIDALRYE